MHYVVSILLFYLFWMLFRYDRLFVQDPVGHRYNYLILMGYALLLLFFLRTYNAHLLGYSRIRTLVVAEFLSQFTSIAFIYLSVTLGWNKLRSPLPFVYMLIFQSAWDVLWAYFGNKIYFSLHPTRKTILIYRNELDKKRFGSISGKPCERLYHITDELCYPGNSFSEIRDRLDGYEAIFVAGVHSRCRNGIAKYCKENNVPGFFLPHVGDVIMQEATHIQSFDSPVLYVTRKHIRPEYRVAKRCMDIILSLLGILILSPIMILTALAVHFYDGGPAIYSQDRLTRDGKVFRIHKFRSMRVDAEKDGVARLSSGEHDDRITPIGRIARRFRLDELPQLFDILRGDMSFVGPRPERPEIAEEYARVMPDFHLRLQVKAGLTGYAQVYGKYNTDPYEKLEFDLLYISHMSLLGDIQMLFATLMTLFSPDSTEGVEDGKINAMTYENNEGDQRDLYAR
ncbi:MAG: sugar transferase [Clostridia bacterium]|nr:sugar transferase [Clostridia bacterium]